MGLYVFFFLLFLTFYLFLLTYFIGVYGSSLELSWLCFIKIFYSKK